MPSNVNKDIHCKTQGKSQQTMSTLTAKAKATVDKTTLAKAKGAKPDRQGLKLECAEVVLQHPNMGRTTFTMWR